MSESSNRAFLYGESVFTTMRMLEGELIDWDYHFERLRKGVEFLYGPFTEGDEWVALFKNRVESRSQLHTGDAIVRLTIYREQARGLLRTGLISISDLKFHFSSSPYEPERAEGKMLKLRTCAAIMKPQWWPSYLKAGNYLDTILSQKLYLKPGDDDILYLSPSDTILASSVANIFVVRHNKLYTAPPGPNVLEGVMRRKVIDSAKDFFDEIEESETNMEQLYKADAIFGTNSVRGLFLIDRVDDHEINYSQDFLSKFDLMRKRVFR